MLETLDYTIRIGSTPTFLYFELYLYPAYAGHYVYNKFIDGPGRAILWPEMARFKNTSRFPLLWLVSEFCKGINIKITSFCMWKPGWPSG